MLGCPRLSNKESATVHEMLQEAWVPSLSQEDALEMSWQPTPVFLPGESHGQRGLAVYSP